MVYALMVPFAPQRSPLSQPNQHHPALSRVAHHRPVRLLQRRHRVVHQAAARPLRKHPQAPQQLVLFSQAAAQQPPLPPHRQ